MEPIAAALARLSKAQSKAQAECAKELEALSNSDSHATSPAWASAGIAAVVRLCHDPAAAADAAATLGNLSRADGANDDSIREAGAIPPLVALLRGGPESEALSARWTRAKAAAFALSNLACNDANRVTITGAGAIPPLVALLRGGPESKAAEVAATALGNLAINDEASTSIIEAGAIPAVVALLSGGPESETAARATIEAAGMLSKLACNNEASSAAIIEAGAIPPLVALLSRGPESEVAGEAAHALSKLTSYGEGKAAIIEAGAIPPLVALLSGGHESEAARRAAGALRDLAKGNEANTSAIVEAGAIPPMVVLLSGGPETEAATVVTLLLIALTGKNEVNRATIIEAGAIPPLVALLSGEPGSEAADNVGMATLALELLSKDAEGRAAIIGAGAIPPLLALLSGGPESEAADNAVGALRSLSKDAEGRAAVIEAGAIPLLVALLKGGPESEAADAVVLALHSLASGTDTIAVLEEVARTQTSLAEEHVSLLRHTLGSCASKRMQAAAKGSDMAALQHAITLATAVQDNVHVDAADLSRARKRLRELDRHATIIGAGDIPPLVALLRVRPADVAEWDWGSDSDFEDRYSTLQDAGRVATVLSNLACNNEANSTTIIEAGAVRPLVALLSPGGPESAAAGSAAAALDNLASGTNTTAVLLEVARTKTDCSSWAVLREKLRKCASARLQAAEGGTCVAALERAIKQATAVQVDAAVMERAQKRLREINGDAERQERRESFGLDSLELPDEFVCPITMDKMRDPVVASDGHSYERSAILSVLDIGNGKSPLTREPLQATLFPNRALKRRMQEHDEDMLRAAATAVANASDGAQQPGPAAGGGEPSSEPAPKRSRV